MTGNLRHSFRGYPITEESTADSLRNRQIQHGRSQASTGQDQLDLSNHANVLPLIENNFQENNAQSTDTSGGSEDSNNSSRQLSANLLLMRGNNARRSIQGRPITEESEQLPVHRGIQNISRIL